MKQNSTIRILLFFFLFSLANASFAQNQKISLQGFLKDDNGKAVENGSYNLTFKIYDVASGGTALWTEAQDLNIYGGVYSVLLGKTVPLAPPALAWDVPYFVGVTIQGTELSPRTELTYSPYALSVSNALTATLAQKVACSGAIGDVKYSILNPTQFALQNGDCWVPMDGRSISGKPLASITGNNSIPNAGGLFIRSQESTNTNYDPDRSYSSTIGTVQSEAFGTHSHSGTTGNPNGNTYSFVNNYKEFKHFSQFENPNPPNASWDLLATYNNSYYSVFSQNEVKANEAYVYTAVHQHPFTTSSAGAVETRPDNINLWTYIRIE